MPFDQMPPKGTVVRGMSDVLGIIGHVADQAARAGAPGVAGHVSSSYGALGTSLVQSPQPQIQRFEITGCWERCNPPPLTGASEGRFWVAQAKPLTYWWGQWDGSATDDGCVEQCDPAMDSEPECEAGGEGEGSDMHSYWDMLGDYTTRVWWPVSSPEDEFDWQRATYPLYGVGQWVWCVFDYQSDTWQVLHGYDDLIRFRLLEPLACGDEAEAMAIGYPCECDEGSSSSDSEQSSTGSEGGGSGCSSGFVVPAPAEDSQDSSAGDCLRDAFRRHCVTITDPNGIVNLAFPLTCEAPACATGWAKRCADWSDPACENYGRWEVVSYGLDACADVSSSASGSSGSGESSSSGSSSSSESSSSSLSESSSSSLSESSSSSLSESSSSSLSSSSSGESCRVVKDVWCNDDGSLTVTYCTIYPGLGGYCVCDDGSS